MLRIGHSEENATIFFWGKKKKRNFCLTFLVVVGSVVAGYWVTQWRLVRTGGSRQRSVRRTSSTHTGCGQAQSDSVAVRIPSIKFTNFC